MNTYFYGFNTNAFDWLEETLESFNMLLEDKHSAYSCNFPPMNSFLDEESGILTLEFALAGYEPEDLDIYLSGDLLKLSSTKKESEDPPREKVKMIKKGIRNRSFEVKYRLPAGKFNVEEASSTFKNGLLTITLPPAASRKPVKLEIKKE